MTKPLVERAQDIETFGGHSVFVRGHYVELDVRKAKTEPPVYAGHAAVRLKDGALILLGANETAIRPQSERDEHRDKEIFAEGILMRSVPTTGAALQLPALFPDALIFTPELFQMLHGDDVDSALP